MDRIKCSRCGLVNLTSDMICRRCAEEIGHRSTHSISPRGAREASKISSALYTCLAILLIGGGAAYLFFGFERSYDDVKANEANRKAAQATPQPEGLSSRSEQDQKRAGQYKNAIAKGPDLAASQKHNEEMQKLMQPDQGNTRK